VSDAYGHYLKHCHSERHVSPASLNKYRDCFDSWLSPWFGQQSVEKISRLQVMDMRQSMMDKNLSVSRQYGVVMCLKSFLKFCREGLGVACLDPAAISLPKRQAPQVE